MTKHATGGAFTTRGRHFLRVTIAPGQRAAVAVPWATSREAALERARVVQALVDRLRAAGHADLVPKVVEAAAAEDPARLEAIGRAVDGLLAGELVKATPKPDTAAPVTFQKFAERWTSGELARLYPDHVGAKRTADDDAMRLKKWVYPVIRDLALRDFTRAHAQEVLRRIPSTMARATRRHVAHLMARVCSLAAYPCELIDASPLPRGFVPRLGARVAFAYLYPSEDEAILRCVPNLETGEAGIPLANRLLYGFLCREGLRCDEALRLTWADVDLARGTLRLDRNKTSDPRTWVMDPSCTRALVAWRELRGRPPAGSPIFVGVFKPYHLARVFRVHLKLAGLTRPELFERSASRRPIRAHDCRGSFVTLALANGRSESWVADRTGHRSSAMLARYRRMARGAEELALPWFSPLDATLPELHGESLAAAKTAADAAAGAGGAPPEATLTPRNRSRFQRVDSNHDRRNQKSVTPRPVADSRVIPRPVEDGGGPSGAPLPRVAAACEGAAEVGHEGAEGAPVASSGEASDDGAIGDRDVKPGEVVEPGPSSAPRDGAEEPRDVVHALALALERASRAGRWDVVAQLGRELEARRLEAAPNVVPIGAKQGGR